MEIVLAYTLRHHSMGTYRRRERGHSSNGPEQACWAKSVVREGWVNLGVTEMPMKQQSFEPLFAIKQYPDVRHLVVAPTLEECQLLMQTFCTRNSVMLNSRHIQEVLQSYQDYDTFFCTPALVCGWRMEGKGCTSFSWVSDSASYWSVRAQAAARFTEPVRVSYPLVSAWEKQYRLEQNLERAREAGGLVSQQAVECTHSMQAMGRLRREHITPEIQPFLTEQPTSFTVEQLREMSLQELASLLGE